LPSLFYIEYDLDRIFFLLVIHDLADPVEIVRDARVDTRHVQLAATDAPGDDAGQLPATVTLADHRTAAITLAGILALFAAGADEARMEIVAGSQSRSSHLLLAHVVADNRYVHLLQYVLILAVLAEGVFAPSGGPASVVQQISIKAHYVYKRESVRKDFLFTINSI